MIRRARVLQRIHSRLLAGEHVQKKHKRIVCALGGNALTQPGQKGTLKDMMDNAAKAAPLLARLQNDMGFELCITHGNGPQVGAIYLQNETSRDVSPAMPLHVCGAQSQGELGYILQTALESQLNKNLREGQRPQTVVQLGTRVRVDTADPAFKKPTKPIGSFYTEAEAREMIAAGKTMVEDAGRGWRCVVPSPNPQQIMEAEAIRTLLDAGMTLVCCGGGGIPVVRDSPTSQNVEGVDAVIDKDLAGERLAALVHASVFVILTDIDGVYLHYRDPEKRQLVHEATPEELRKWSKEGHFAAGSMAPKVEAVCRFIETRPDCVAYITSLENLCEAIEGRAGTCVRYDPSIVSHPVVTPAAGTTPTEAADEPINPTPSKWSSREEWGKPTMILMHRPNDCGEMGVPVIHPAAALFEKGFDPEDAARDHRGYVQMLEARGVRVLLLKDLLSSKAASDPEWLARLRNLAKACVVLDLSAIPEVDHAAHRETVLSSIDALSPKLLVDTIVNRPRIHPSETSINTKFEARYEIQPEMNLFFCRDQIITTAKGPVLSHMNSTQRVSEVRLVKLALEILGTPPIFAVTGDGRLEGGDFIPAGDWAFQGQGLRTNESAVKQLLAADVYGCRFVCVVKDSWQDQEEMHLDTFFNIAGREVCTLVETRYRAERGTQQYLKCDVYERVRGTYHLRSRNVGFIDVLHQAGFKHIISVPKADQLIYGCNYLCMGDKDIILVKREGGVSDVYKDRLIEAGVRFVECDMTSLTKGYGAAHCTTQVCRSPFVPK